MAFVFVSSASGMLFPDIIPLLSAGLWEALGEKPWEENHPNTLQKPADSFPAPFPCEHAYFSLYHSFMFIVCIPQLEYKFHDVRDIFAHFVFTPIS